MAHLSNFVTLIFSALIVGSLASSECDLSLQEQIESLVSDFPSKFDPVQDYKSVPYCASSAPASSLPLGSIANVGSGVKLSGKAQCALYCQSLAGCVGFNYRSVAAADGSQCDLYTKAASRCQLVADGSCQYYEVPGNPTVCTDVSSFTYSPSFGAYYLVITERLTFEESLKKCNSYGPNAHLAILRNDVDYAGAKDFITKSGTNNICAPSEWDGYWIGLRRRIDSCKDFFVWVLNESLEGSKPVVKPSDLTWATNQPDCYNNDEYYVNLAGQKDLKLNDMKFSKAECGLCQVFA